ncbi:MAG: ATP-binding protein [Polyangiales bacterium]
MPDAASRRAVRSIASCYPIAGLHAAVSVVMGPVEDCVREIRRTLFEGPLAVLTWSEGCALRALAAGADEAFALASVALDAETWSNLAERARVKAALRRAAEPRLAALRDLEKLCALGRLVSGMAEELSDPLSAALLSLELLRVELDPLYAGVSELRRLAASSEPVASEALRDLVGKVRGSADTPRRAHRVLAEVADACESIANVARELGLHAHDQAPRELVDVSATVDKILRLLTRAVGKATLVERDYAPALPALLAPRAEVAQVLISLIANALASLRAQAHSAHRLHVSIRAEDARLAVTVSHTGRALDADAVAHIFAPDTPDAGLPRDPALGLELSVARSVAQALGGDLRVGAHAEGKSFVAWFAVAKEHELEAVRPTFVPPQRAGRPRIARPRSVLVVEPEAAPRAAMSALLGEHYDVLLAEHGAEAQRLLVGGAKPDVVVVSRDDSEGRRLVEWLLRERPELTRRLLISTQHGEADEPYGLSLLARPIDPSALLRGIEERLRAPLRRPRPQPVARAGFDSASPRAASRFDARVQNVAR